MDMASKLFTFTFTFTRAMATGGNFRPNHYLTVPGTCTLTFMRSSEDGAFAREPGRQRSGVALVALVYESAQARIPPAWRTHRHRQLRSVHWTPI